MCKNPVDIQGGNKVKCRVYQDLQRSTDSSRKEGLVVIIKNVCSTFSPPTRKRSMAARLMQSFSQRPSSRSLMDTPALRGTEQHEPSGRLMLHCLKGAPHSAGTEPPPPPPPPRGTSAWSEGDRRRFERRSGPDVSLRFFLSDVSSR